MRNKLLTWNGLTLKTSLWKNKCFLFCFLWQGRDITPYVLSRVNAITSGASLTANISLVENNARVAGKIASCLAKLRSESRSGSRSHDLRHVSRAPPPAVNQSYGSAHKVSSQPITGRPVGSGFYFHFCLICLSLFDVLGGLADLIDVARPGPSTMGENFVF